MMSRKHTVRARPCLLIDIFLEALKEKSSGLTMLWIKCKIAVKSKQTLRYNLMNLFSDSIPVNPVWSAKMKKSIAETVPMLRSSGSSTNRKDCINDPTWLAIEDKMLVIPSTATTVSQPRMRRVFVASHGLGPSKNGPIIPVWLLNDPHWLTDWLLTPFNRMGSMMKRSGQGGTHTHTHTPTHPPLSPINDDFWFLNKINPQLTNAFMICFCLHTHTHTHTDHLMRRGYLSAKFKNTWLESVRWRMAGNKWGEVNQAKRLAKVGKYREKHMVL